jgi:hypothetical protein
LTIDLTTGLAVVESASKDSEAADNVASVLIFKFFYHWNLKRSHSTTSMLKQYDTGEF